MKAIVLAALSLGVFQVAPAPANLNGSISGIVIQVGTDQPIDAVQIIMTPVNTVGRPSPALNNIQTYTDLSGRFTLPDIPPGRYRMQWQRTGFSTPEVGTPAPEKPVVENLKTQLGVEKVLMPSPLSSASVVVDVAPQQQITGFAFFLVGGGVISGRLTDSQGEPVASVTMTALTVNYEDGHRVLRPTNARTIVVSDDRGNYRLYGLRPGEYFVRADRRSSLVNSPENSHTYFPGVQDVSAAVPIVVGEKSETPNANFSIPSFGSIRISGKVTGGTRSSAESLSFYLLANGPRILDDPAVLFHANQRTSVGEKVSGVFEIREVPQGSYDLYAVSFDQGSLFMGHTAVFAGSQDIENLTIALEPAESIEGRAVLEDGSPYRGAFTVRYRDIAGSLSRTPDATAADAEGKFLVRQVHEGRYSLTVNATDLCILDIQQDGKSVYDKGFSIEESRSPLTVILSNRCGAVQTEVLDDMQRPVKAAFVALVPATARRQNPLLFRRSPYDAAGTRYVPIEQIPPGEYKIFAWDRIPTYAEMNPEFLMRFEDRGVPLTVEPGANLKVQVPLIVTK